MSRRWRSVTQNTLGLQSVSCWPRGQKNDFAAAEERRKENAEIARRHARELEDRKVEAARLQLEADQTRVQILKWKIIDRRDLQRRREEEERAKVTARWLQVDFPTQLARRCIHWCQAQRRSRRDGYKQVVANLVEDKVFERRLVIRDL